VLFLSRKEEETSQFFSTVRPEEVPEIPSNKFLLRGSPPKKVEADRCVFLGYSVFTIAIRLRYDDTTMHSTTTKVIEITICIRFDYSTTKTKN